MLSKSFYLENCSLRFYGYHQRQICWWFDQNKLGSWSYEERWEKTWENKAEKRKYERAEHSERPNQDIIARINKKEKFILKFKIKIKVLLQKHPQKKQLLCQLDQKINNQDRLSPMRKEYNANAESTLDP